MADYGHDLTFGTFITPSSQQPHDVVALAQITAFGVRLASLARLQGGDLERGNLVIDDAAVAAGRHPRQIRRLVNIHGSFTSDSHGFLQGPPDQWVEELLPFVLEHGISTFILATDDPHAIQRWGGEVAPALRETVERERQESSSRSRSQLNAF